MGAKITEKTNKYCAKEEKKDSTLETALIIIGCVLAAIAILALVFFIIRKRSNTLKNLASSDNLI